MNNSAFYLSGQTALVTGCKRGIGYAMAMALANAGADIIGVSASLEAHGSDIEKAVHYGSSGSWSRIDGPRFSGFFSRCPRRSINAAE